MKSRFLWAAVITWVLPFPWAVANVEGAGTTPHLYAVVLADGVNIRAEADPESPIVGRVWHGVRMKMFAFERNWCLVEIAPDQKGWIRSDFIKTVASTDMPEAPAAPTVREATSEEAGAYRIQVGDEIAIKSYRNPEINGVVQVRPDGCISSLFVDDVYVVGITPAGLDALLTARYKKYFRSPDITVIVQKIRELEERRVYVGGEVEMPKELELQFPRTVLQAIFASGGFLDTAKRKNVILIRKGPENRPLVYSLDLRDIENEYEAVGENVYLKPFDIVYVPNKEIAKANVFVKHYIDNMLPEKPSLGFSWFGGNLN